MLRKRVNPANDRTLIWWSGVCPLLNWFYWEIEKGVRKGSNCSKTLDKDATTLWLPRSLLKISFLHLFKLRPRCLKF